MIYVIVIGKIYCKSTNLRYIFSNGGIGVTSTGKQKISHKANQFTESVIREMTRVALQYGAVNLAQGFPDFPCPPELKRAACKAIEEDVNQYA